MAVEASPATLIGKLSLAGRTALVTGSSAGIGRSIAEELAGLGATVAVHARSLERSEPVAEALRVVGGRAVALAGDLGDTASAQSLVGAAIERLDGLDILVNNAGIGFAGASAELAHADWQRVIDLDLTAPFICAQTAGRHMIKRGRGVVVNVSSMFGHVGVTGRAAYCAAKHGLAGLTKVLAVEWARHGVRVLSVDPGYVGTELVQANVARGAVSEQAIRGRTPLGRLAEPAEIARVVAFLASDAAAYMTGGGVLVDGGWVADGGW